MNDRMQPIVIRAKCTVHGLAVALRPIRSCRGRTIRLRARRRAFIVFHIRTIAIDFIFAMQEIILAYRVHGICTLT